MNGYRDRERGLYVLRFFLVLVFTVGGAAGFSILTNRQAYSLLLRCLGGIGWLATGLLILLLVTGIARARGERRVAERSHMLNGSGKRIVRTENDVLSMIADVNSPNASDTLYYVDIDVRTWNHADWMNAEWVLKNRRKNIVIKKVRR